MLVSSALTERAAHGAVMGLLPAPLCRRRCRHGCACGTVEWRKVGARVLVRRNGGQHRHAVRAVCAQPLCSRGGASDRCALSTDVTTDVAWEPLCCRRGRRGRSVAQADDDLAALLHGWHAVEGLLVDRGTKAA